MALEVSDYIEILIIQKTRSKTILQEQKVFCFFSSEKKILVLEGKT
jgi:hypothetical protein